MSVFVVVPQLNPNPVSLEKAIKAAFPEPHETYVLDDGKGWLISTTGTAQALSDKLQITSGETGGALVVEAASYFGRANANIWTWIRSSLERSTNV